MEASNITGSAADQKRGRMTPASLFGPVAGVVSHGDQLKPLLAKLVTDFLEPAWADLEAVLAQGVDDGVHASIVHQLQRHPALLAAAVFRLADVRCLLQVSRTESFVGLLTISLPAWEKAVASCQAMWRGLLGSNDGPAQAAIYIQDRMRLLCATVSALATMMDWIQHRHFGAMPASIIEVALAQANAPARVVDALWGGDDSLLQAVLLRTHHPDQVWPSSMLGKRALAALRKRVPVALASLIDASGPDAEHGIFWPLIDDRKAAVVNIPVLMGIWAMTGIGMNWWNRSGRLCQVAEICAFDRVWFNTAYNQGTKIALAYGVQSQHGGDL